MEVKAPTDTWQPYRCPICYGTGQVDNGFYNRTQLEWTSTSTAPEPCRSCQGTGIVWRCVEVLR